MSQGTSLNVTAAAVRLEAHHGRPLVMILKSTLARWIAAVGLAALVWAPAKARANGGGVLDRDIEFKYNDLVYVVWLTGDGRCDKGGFCFRLTRSDHRKPFLSDLESGEALRAVPTATAGAEPRTLPPLEARDISKLSAPGASPNLVLAQVDSRDGPWVVYDLAARRYVVEDAPHDVALAAWTRLGLAPPKLISAEPGPPALTETLRSRTEGWVSDAFFLTPCLLVVLVGAGFLWWIGRTPRPRPRTS